MEDQQTRTMTWMAGILLALVAVVVLIKPDKKEDDDGSSSGSVTTTDPFPDLVAGDITEIALTPADQPPIRLTRQDDGGWNLTAPLSTPADSTAVSAILSALESLECSDDLGADDLAQFGLQPPVVAVSATSTDGRTYALRVGRDTPVGWTTYVQCGEGDSATRTSKQKLSASFPTSVEDLRDRSALSLSAFDVVSALTITTPTPSPDPTAEGEAAPAAEGGISTLMALQTAEGSGRWTVGEARRPADQGRAQDLVRKLREITIEAFSAAPLMPPITTLTLSTASGESAAIQVGANGSALVPTQQAPVILDEATLSVVLSAQPDDLLSHELFSTMQPGEATDLTISLGERTFEASRADNGWSNPAAEDLIATLQVVRVERSLSPSVDSTATAATTPWGTLRIQSGTDRLEEIDIFSPSSDEPSTYPAHNRTTGEHFQLPATEVGRMKEALPAS